MSWSTNVKGLDPNDIEIKLLEVQKSQEGLPTEVIEGCVRAVCAFGAQPPEVRRTYDLATYGHHDEFGTGNLSITLNVTREIAQPEVPAPEESTPEALEEQRKQTIKP